MTHYGLWSTWNFEHSENNLFLFYVHHPAPHLPRPGVDEGAFLDMSFETH